MKQVRPVTIRNGRLIGMDEVSKGSIRFDDGRIVAVGAIDPQPEDEIVDARGKLVAPALVDYGVFAVDKAASHMGGIARVALMPDQTPPLDYPARVNFIAKSGKPDLWVHPFSAATSGLLGRELSEIALMREAGARGIATGRTWLADSGVMFRLLQYAAMLDEVVIAHAEDGGLAGPAVATAAEMASRQGLPSAPAEAEALAIARDLQLASMAAARLHIRQVTTRVGLDLVRSAKRAGIRVTAGVTPAHFALSELALAGFRSFARLSPPLRTESDRLAVREAIADGTIDVIASGHDPRNVEEKRLPFADAAPGMAGARTLLSLSLELGSRWLGYLATSLADDGHCAGPIARCIVGTIDAGIRCGHRHRRSGRSVDCERCATKRCNQYAFRSPATARSRLPVIQGRRAGSGGCLRRCGARKEKPPGARRGGSKKGFGMQFCLRQIPYQNL